MYIVDRIEGDYVVCETEDKSFVDLKIDLFPTGVKAGDVVYEEQGRFLVCKDETEKRNARIRQMMDDLWED